ncbi:MAG: bifunctional precorrin-2 dehydrogenase/sirohydrochlorin ferrochelatase [Acidimicrobiia bacterium]
MSDAARLERGSGGRSGARPSLVGYPANFIVAGRRCLVVGAGRIAARKLDGLLKAGADAVAVALDAIDSIRALHDAGRIEWRQRGFVAADLDDVWLAITATADAAVNQAVFDAGEARRVWVNSADDPANCSFTLMSVVRQGDLVVTIGTNGRSPALATFLRDHVNHEMGPEYERLLEILSEAREAFRAGGRSSEDADWQRAFDSGIVEMVRSGREAEARELLRSCL